MSTHAPASISTRAPRVVLDTNVCLDLWVFADPRAAVLRAALRSGEVEAVTNVACRDEWLRVLDYGQLRLDAVARRDHADAYDGLVHCLPGDAPSRRPGVRLPICTDPDDQKFLQLALDCGAHWLVSRDAQVLALGRRTRRDNLFQIVPPQAWTPLP